MPRFFMFLANAAEKDFSFRLGLDKGLYVCYLIDKDPDSKPCGLPERCEYGY